MTRRKEASKGGGVGSAGVARTRRRQESRLRIFLAQPSLLLRPRLRHRPARTLPTNSAAMNHSFLILAATKGQTVVRTLTLRPNCQHGQALFLGTYSMARHG
ncbi:hypothetical protein C351_06620 [Cryptococcus neoformans c8]|nr:hypothetical protein C353_06595 [Cryptococcus neoformans var. grubii AD1-83a]OXG45882.1 hypothetical protein C354_06578 [Cryptococcus neoformans var. grubii MW-RSA1955]OXG49481.1 hypothetical protein C352_06597 [Cryptococcus neoformans var. grubii CHC193]OXG57061.1 hypothetical protein C351_06620 [Cryptococcus neoformans var. grubii c8]OXG71996.1 hypothetical protein C350_06537 [Cryptococcus neoformans var. grubii MW-RSA36]OXH01476.1 hypothetical protein C369_06712 [Cryptococcus neoformans 